ncbi:MAG: hypothetical protein AAGA44_01935 [Pseudomonadota bacterium]
MPRSVVVLIFLLLSPAALAGTERYTFDDWNGPAIKVRIATPKEVTPDTPIVIVIHGWSRDVMRYFGDWRELSKKHGFIAVVPHFPVNDFEGANEFNQGHVFDRETGELRPSDTWTFAAIEAVFDDVVERLGSEQTRYSIYGHSAGSQFVHRYLWHVPDARVKRYLAANAGWYTLPDYDIDYPYGLNEANVSKEQLAAALGKDVILMLGKEDTETASPNLRNTPEARAQGPNRYMRGLTMYAKARKAAEDLGVEFTWKLAVVEEAGHVNAQMAKAAATFVE